MNITPLAIEVEDLKSRMLEHPSTETRLQYAHVLRELDSWIPPEHAHVKARLNQEATNTIESVLSCEPRHPEALALRVQYSKGSLRIQYINELRSVMQHIPDNSNTPMTAYAMAAYVLMTEVSVPKSFMGRVIETILNTDPYCWRGYVVRAILEHDRKRHDLEARDYLLAHVLNPSNPDIIYSVVETQAVCLGQPGPGDLSIRRQRLEERRMEGLEQYREQLCRNSIRMVCVD